MILSKLFSPFQLKNLELANRVVIPPMSQYSVGTDGLIGAWHQQHVGRMALSGAGLVIMEAHGVEAEGRISAHDLGMWNDDQAALLKSLLGTVREYSSTPIGIQLNHAGRKAGTNPPWVDAGHSMTDEQGGWPTVAPSAIPYKPGWRVPGILDEAGMARITQAFVDAALRAYAADVDFVELHAANGYLLSQFLSPLSNQRTDDFGGTPENRMRFPLQVARALRDAWPQDRPLGVRFNGSEFAPEGLALEEAVAFSSALHAIGYDYLHVSGGYNIYDQQAPAEQPGYMVNLAGAVKSANPDAVVIAVGLIYEGPQAEAIVQSGKTDLVAVGRGFLDDANWAIHAAIALGDKAPGPSPYDRFGPLGWPTHKVHAAAAD
jgi:2,4-dienoyl-CoA reductase-like NADH-dependent reductase (Old Yellow Enzyme family)